MGRKGAGRPGALFLIGYRGSGKTSVARAVAAQLPGTRVCDTDTLIEEALGMPISRCFAERGEAHFRSVEGRVLKEVIASLRAGERAVVATGGGVVVTPENIELMREAGLVVWLVADAETLRGRIESDGEAGQGRPALRGVSSGAEVEELLREREPLYRRAAHERVVTAGLGVDDVAAAVLDLWR